MLADAGEQAFGLNAREFLQALEIGALDAGPMAGDAVEFGLKGFIIESRLGAMSKMTCSTLPLGLIWARCRERSSSNSVCSSGFAMITSLAHRP